MIADMPTAVSGTELIIKYDIGANIVPARQTPSPSILYGLLTIFTPRIVVPDTQS